MKRKRKVENIAEENFDNLLPYSNIRLIIFATKYNVRYGLGTI